MTCCDVYSNSGNVFECTISTLILVSFGNFIGEYQALFPVYIHVEQDCIYCMPVCYNHITAKLQNWNQNFLLIYHAFALSGFEQPNPGALLIGSAKSV